MKTNNLNGKQQGDESVKRFTSWVAEREAAKDWADYIRSGKLNRSEIAMECGFDRAAFRQNPTLRELLASTEKTLSEDGIFALQRVETEAADVDAERSDEAVMKRLMSAKGKTDQRLKAVEEQNAALRAEVKELRSQLEAYKMIEEHLATTGRFIRP